MWWALAKLQQFGQRLLRDEVAPTCNDNAWLEIQRRRRRTGFVKTKVSDDRGAMHPTLPLRYGELRRRGLHRHLWFYYAVQVTRPRVRWGVALSWALCMAIALLNSASLLVTSEELAWYWSLPMVGFLIFIHVALFQAFSRANICVSLHAGACPTCRYAMSDLEVQADGCTVCPECGSAWKLPPTPPHVQPTTHTK